MPQRFIYLLGRIDDKEDQEVAVRNGVTALFDKHKTECLEHLVSALSEWTLSGDLEDVAIRGLSVSLFYPDEGNSFVERFFDHPAISAKDYSDALHDSYKMEAKLMSSLNGCWKEQIVKTWRQSRRDKRFSERWQEFQNAVNKAVGIESRHGPRHQKRVAAVKEALDLPTVLLDMIGGYIEWLKLPLQILWHKLTINLIDK